MHTMIPIVDPNGRVDGFSRARTERSRKDAVTPVVRAVPSNRQMMELEEGTNTAAMPVSAAKASEK